MKRLGLGDLTLPPDAVTDFQTRAVRVDSGCLEWTGGRYAKGYGRFWLKGLGTEVLAHRAAFWIAHGWWPKVVRHDCDNPPCVDPEHLLAGTQQDNIDDRTRRGHAAAGLRNGMHTRPDRRPVGERSGMHKLSVAQVAEIRAGYIPRVTPRHVIASRYGVSKNTVDRVLAGLWGAAQ